MTLSCSEEKISVIIPIYNSEKFFAEALDSLINQTYKNLEIICINDGSTDNSLKLIKDYMAKDNRIKLIDKPNSGYGATVNKGIEEATGEYIAIFEPDDILEPNIYETLYKEIKENDLNVVKCNFNFFKSLENKKKRSGLIAKCSSDKVFRPKDKLQVFACHASVWAGLYKKEFLIQNNIRFQETPGASYQDMSFTFKVLALAGNIKLLATPLINYRFDNPSSSVNNPKKIYCVCDEYDELTRFLNANQELKKCFNTQKLINQYKAYRWNLAKLDKTFKTEFLQKYSDTFKEFFDNGEITKDFYKTVSRTDLDLLINNPEVFYDKNINKNYFYWIKNLFAKKK